MIATRTRALPVLAALACLTACGGGGGPASSTPPTTTPAPSTRSATFSGTTSISATGTCVSARHAFDAGAGTITITLNQASAGAVGVQQCNNSAVNHAVECAIPPFARVAVGASLQATLRGERSQYLTVVPDGCDRPGTGPVDVTYTLTLSYPG